MPADSQRFKSCGNELWRRFRRCQMHIYIHLTAEGEWKSSLLNLGLTLIQIISEGAGTHSGGRRRWPGSRPSVQAVGGSPAQEPPIRLFGHELSLFSGSLSLSVWLPGISGVSGMSGIFAAAADTKSRSAICLVMLRGSDDFEQLTNSFCQRVTNSISTLLATTWHCIKTLGDAFKKGIPPHQLPISPIFLN